MRLAQWGIRNPVPTNLITILLVMLGIAAGVSLTRELFPKFVLDVVEARRGGVAADVVAPGAAQGAAGCRQPRLR